MRQHKLALCGIHFSSWVLEQTERNIKKYRMFTRNDRILIAVSGGKDSLALWDVLSKLGYDTIGLYIDLGINGDSSYSSESRRFASSFAEQHHLPLVIYSFPERYSVSVPEIAAISRRNKNKPCAICGLVKRHTFNQVASQEKCNVVVTGHNLDDEAAVLYHNTLNWQIEFLRRQAPVLPAKEGFLRKAKPFCRFYERETAAYALINAIEYIEDECPYTTGSTTIEIKQILNQLEHEHAGTKLAFYLKFLQAKPELFPTINTDLVVQDDLVACQTCGQPTEKPGHCAFCRLLQEVETKKAG